jgi:putative acetyltransferase
VVRGDVRAEIATDLDAIRDVHVAAFGQPAEARLVDALRQGARPYVGLVAVERDRVVGHIAFTGAILEAYAVESPIVALGPMAVRPDRQRQGIGSALVRAGLSAIRESGRDVVVVVGHPAFYPRFGFVPARPLGLLCEYPVPDDVFMVAELGPGALRGRRGLVRYAPEFGGRSLSGGR